jgi:hypothetical protein
MSQADLIFDPELGLIAPDTETVRTAVAGDYITAFKQDGKPDLDVDPTTPAGQLVDAETAEIQAKNADFLLLANQFDPNVAEGRWQDALGHIYFLERKIAQPSVAQCQVTGAAGTVIPFGSIVTSTGGVKLYAQRAITIGADGNGQGYFQCSLPGPTPLPADSVTSITTTVPGWDTVNNAAAGVTGRDTETRADFEARRAASVAKNAHGSRAALEGALSDLGGQAGVIDCKVMENVGPANNVQYGVSVPAHGVMVCIFGGLEADIARTIYLKKGGGADTGYFSQPNMLGNTTIQHIAANEGGAVYNYRILRPYLTNFFIKVMLYSPNVRPDTRTVIGAALVSDFNGNNGFTLNPNIGLAQTVLAERFSSAVRATGAKDALLDLRIALDSGTGIPDTNNAAWVNVVNIPGSVEPTFTAGNILFVAQGA